MPRTRFSRSSPTDLGTRKGYNLRLTGYVAKSSQRFDFNLILFLLFWKEYDKDFKINWRRVAISSMFGFAFVGPVGHHWYEHLDRFIRLRLQLKPKSVKFVATKVAADGLIFGPLDLLIYLSYIGLASGKSMPQVKDDIKRDFLPGFVVGGGVWPIVQVANFRFIPVRYQLLYVNVFCLLDSSFLSWLEQQGDASWKQWLTSSLGLENHNSRG
ncbi:hypothetical protein Taro_024340 [Colocasia esculenta]|uniref:Uncharacterized protein n=1 Tax=Colocasia esculenta TaxID=4460 RepID=A0A843VB28_COLES|nr:hypothetical protein [Colocasia esculenta]